MQRGFPVLAASVGVRPTVQQMANDPRIVNCDGAGQGSVMVSFDGVRIGSHLEGFFDALQVVVGDCSKERLVWFVSSIRIGPFRHKNPPS